MRPNRVGSVLPARSVPLPPASIQRRLITAFRLCGWNRFVVACSGVLGGARRGSRVGAGCAVRRRPVGWDAHGAAVGEGEPLLAQRDTVAVGRSDAVQSPLGEQPRPCLPVASSHAVASGGPSFRGRSASGPRQGRQSPVAVSGAEYGRTARASALAASSWEQPLAFVEPPLFVAECDRGARLQSHPLPVPSGRWGSRSLARASMSWPSCRRCSPSARRSSVGSCPPSWWWHSRWVTIPSCWLPRVPGDATAGRPAPWSVASLLPSASV